MASRRVHHSEGIHIATGGTLLAIRSGGLLTLAIASAATPKAPHSPTLTDRWWYWLAVSIFGLLALAGIWLVVGVYWERLWLPTTALARAMAADLSIWDVSIAYREENRVRVRVGLYNAGRGDVKAATVNIWVPESALNFRRTDKAGNQVREGKIEPVDGYPFQYWQKTGLHFPGRVAWPFFFDMDVPDLDEPLEVRAYVISADLDEHLQAEVSLDPREITQPRGVDT